MDRQSIGDDLMIGAKGIAAWLNVSPRKVFYWGETGLLPLFKIGGRWAERNRRSRGTSRSLRAVRRYECAPREAQALNTALMLRSCLNSLGGE